MELLVRLKHGRTGRLSFANDDSIIERENLRELTRNRAAGGVEEEGISILARQMNE